VLARFDPGSADRADATHPAAADRVWLSLDVLRRMNEGPGLLRPLSAPIDALEAAWSGMVEDATGAPPAPRPDAQRLATIGEVFWDLLELKAPGVRYRSWRQAMTAAEDLLEAVRTGRALDAEPTDLRDVLNTAWAARLAGMSDAVMPVADWALRACIQLVPTEGAVEEDDH
jgi:hypothetical protein